MGYKAVQPLLGTFHVNMRFRTPWLQPSCQWEVPGGRPEVVWTHSPRRFEHQVCVGGALHACSCHARLRCIWVQPVFQMGTCCASERGHALDQDFPDFAEKCQVVSVRFDHDTVKESLLQADQVDAIPLNYDVFPQELIDQTVAFATEQLGMSMSEWQKEWCTPFRVSLYLRGRNGDVMAAGKLVAKALEWRRQHWDLLTGQRTPIWQGDMRILCQGGSGDKLGQVMRACSTGKVPNRRTLPPRGVTSSISRQLAQKCPKDKQI